jgi:cell division inhibitor SepF
MKNVWHRALAYFGLAEDEEFEDLSQDYDEYEEPSPYPERPTVKKIQRNDDRSTILRSITSPSVKVHVVEPRSFNDAQRIADKFKASIPVIVNLQSTDSDLSKRLIDFASGLTYGLNGGMQRVAERVFLLTPSNVEVSAEERRRLQEKGFFNQL